MANEVQQVEVDLRKASTKIENLEARLEGLPADAPAAKVEYLQESILALRREKELLLQRLPPIQGMGLVGNISSISQVRLGCWRSPGPIRRQVVCSVQ